MVVSFDVRPLDTLALAAFFAYPSNDAACSGQGISASLDGVMLELSPNATRRLPSGCRLGFYLTAPPPPDTPQSTVRVTAGGVDSVFVTSRLLEPRRWLTTRKDSDVVEEGNAIDFIWSVDSDGPITVDASFSNGADRLTLIPSLVGATATVVVPHLTAGSWTLQIGGIAHAAVISCDGAQTCSSQIVRQDALSVVVR